MTSSDRPFTVDYDHEVHRQFHSSVGARRVLRLLFKHGVPTSVLDVGCGCGTWLEAALEAGATEVMGIDGVDLPQGSLAIPKQRVRRANLNRPIELGRRFDLVICLETVEHLAPESSSIIIDTLVRHGERILFSAAVPGQPGTHHINCRWPSFWQRLFNERGYWCDDSIRWALWEDPDVEPWYRQNMMLATRDWHRAGGEPRVKSVIHPDILPYHAWAFFAQNIAALEQGVLPTLKYAAICFRAAWAKLRRAWRRIRELGSPPV